MDSKNNVQAITGRARSNDAKTHGGKVHGARAMWVIAFELLIVFAGSTMLTPLYLLYQRRFGFGAITLTLVYAAYVIGNLLALFFFGRLSDQIGRKKTTWPALVVATLSTLAFAFAPATAWLFAGRILSGFANGLSSGAATAWITELHPSKNKEDAAVIAVGGNVLGLAVGPLMGGVLARYAPWPLHLSFFIYLGLLAVAALAVATVPETVREAKSGWKQVSLAPRVGVPREIRMQFISPALTAFGIMSLVGFYAALAPGLLAQDLHRGSPAVSGVVVFAFFLIAAITDLTVRTRLESGTAMLLGLGLLFPSLALLVSAQAVRSMPLLIAGIAVGGCAMALAYFGSMQVVNQIAPEDQRSEVISSYMIFCYLGNSVPVIGIGFLSGMTGSMTAHVIFAIVVAVLAAVGLVTGVKYAPKRETGVEEQGEQRRRAS